jgi:hypothetical protein
MRDGYAAARKIAERWKLEYQRDNIYFKAGDVSQLFEELIRICYLTPLVAKALPLSLGLYNLWGRLGLAWVRRQIRHHDY